MAELVISALLPLLFEKLASAVSKNITRNKGIDVEIKKWQRSLVQIQGVLSDAAQKEISSQPVKRWLNDLQHLAYDIDDMLDGLATEAMHREFNRESEAITSKVRKLIPTCCTSFSRGTRMHDQLDIITAKLKDLVEEKDALNLSVKEEPKPKDKNRKLQTSMVHASNIVGREAEKKALVHKLLEDEPSNQNFSIVPIVGMGGVGKTTLARLLYDEEQVQRHFALKAWVCVSDDFDSFAISKVIFESVTGGNKDFADLNLLQVALRDHLREKRFLLVLDDVWSESCEDWETLVGPFHACASGSKIIMTTRKDNLLKKLGYNHLNQQLQSLSHDDALSLVALHAFGVNNFDSHLSLKPYGEGIVKKCDGLPLALIALGRLLRTKNGDEDYWNEVLNSEIWRLQDGGGIVPALRLSYHDLSAHLKQLFAYCSLFPKDVMFDKEELVLLWMAEGFLHKSTSSDSTKERLGLEYFDELLSRSFFQHAPNNKSLFVMHDMINDLATSVAGEFFVRLENENDRNGRKEMLEKCRHMAFVRERYVTYKKFEAFERATSLRTFLATPVEDVGWWNDFYLSNRIMVDLILKLPLLRVLCLSGFLISEIPESIGTLKHLRYLNLSRTRIVCLPESVCYLYNLETLVVFGCRCLAKLPKSFLNLKNLRHLDIRGTPLLDQMPFGIKELKSLQTLSKIIIGGESRFEIAQLRDLKNICGKIDIVGLEKVKSGIHAREANFSQKRLSELKLQWSNVLDGSRNEMLEKEVLNELKPHNDRLIKLKIRSYGGLEFPDWVGDPSFLRLKHVSLRDCNTCTSLPPLGQLPLLEELFIEGLDGVKVVGIEVLGTSCSFPSLAILSIKHMKGWKKWSAISTRVMFPCLEALLISDCPNLVEVTLDAVPSLGILQIINCNSVVLRKLVQVASSVTKMEISNIFGLNDVVWRHVIGYLGSVEELTLLECNEIRYLWESEAVVSKILVNLRILRVDSCGKLVNLGEREEGDNCRGNLMTSLRILEVSWCNKMERFRCPDSIEDLSVKTCNEITYVSLPTHAQKLKSVVIEGCNKLLEKEWGGQNIRSSMPMLEHLYISDWPNLKSIIELNYLARVTKLSITSCESLESFPENELPNMTSLEELHIRNCPSIDACFPRGIWPPNLQSLYIGELKKPISEWRPQNFPTSLVKLHLYGGGDDEVSSCSQFSRLLPSSLTSLTIQSFEKLKSVSAGLQHLTSLQRLSFYQCANLKEFSHPQQLTSLQHLYFETCPNLNKLSHPRNLTSLQRLGFFECPSMMDLPEAVLPSLLHLTICDNLIERCSRSGHYWPLISHIPCIETEPLAWYDDED